MADQNCTPLMKQWHDIKAVNPDKIIFFRLGDFYEMFYDDAVEASSILQITLTKRQEAPMCGIPFHAADNYLRRLIQSGKKIAIVEQDSGPVKGKGIISRSVTQVITPGTVTEFSMLDGKNNNFLSAIYFSQAMDKNCNEADIYFCALDISTGEVEISNLSSRHPKVDIETFLARYNPREIILPENIRQNNQLDDVLFRPSDYLITDAPEYVHSAQYSRQLIEKYYSHSADSVLNNEKSAGYTAALASVLYYVSETQRGYSSFLKIPRIITGQSCMQIDATSQKNLELIRNSFDNSNKNSLLDAIDETITPMGGRLLFSSILKPLVHSDEINRRLTTVEYLKNNFSLLNEIRTGLKGIHDIERICARIIQKKVLPRELVTFKNSLVSFQNLTEIITGLPYFKSADTNPDSGDICRVVSDITNTILPEPDNIISNGSVINPHSDSELLGYITSREQGNEWIAELLAEEKNASGIGNLKIKYTDVSGYFFEISKAAVKNAPAHFIRKQTLVNAERFTTEKLLSMQEKILSAGEKAIQREKALYEELLLRIIGLIDSVQSTVEFIAYTDMLCSFSFTAFQKNYCKPVFTDEPILSISGGRHPVIERAMHESYIPNDLHMNNTNSVIHIITGPNMSGKSTFLRQNAVIVLLAHMGSFVPAHSCTLSICDKIFTRIGASDNLTRGESTFLLEMNETAHILTNMTEKSLVIMDEIGRGTSTRDGLSLARSIVEYIHTSPSHRCKTLFATHYHELTAMEGKFSSIRNFHFSVHEERGKITFLKKLRPGATDQSYGIHVAEIARMPAMVIARAQEILQQLKQSDFSFTDLHEICTSVPEVSDSANDITYLKTSLATLLQMIGSINLDTTTPIDALNLIAELQKYAGSLEQKKI